MDKNAPINHEPQTERFERFVALDAGQFWKVVGEDVASQHERIDVGDIMLISNIDYVDEQAHTISVLIHPRKVKPYSSKTVLFRVEEFLRSFEFVDQQVAQKDRENCLAEIQGRISDAQIELAQASSDTNTLDEYVRRDTPPEEGETHLPVVREALPNGVVGAIKTQKVTALMTKGLTDTGVEQIKSAMQHQVDVVQKRAGWLTKKTSKLATIAGEMTPFFEEQAAVALAETSEMVKHIDKLMKGIGSLNLYTLKDVDVFNINEGVSAPSDVKLTITQSILYMDEELAVFAPIHKGFDCRSRDQFFEQLPKHQGLIDQIFPTERCVVGMATTRIRHDYSGYSARQADRLERQNALVFFLVRDGSNIYGVVSPELMHQFTPRLFPSWDQMQRPFRGVRGEDITYDSVQYTSSLDKFELMSLTYKRILILLCGLDHNKQLFGEFYEEGASLEFVTQAFQEKYLNFIHDDDGTNMLNDKPKRTIYDWLGDVNTTITNGSRVLLDWRDCFTQESIPSAFERPSNWHSRSHSPSLLFTPDDETRNGYLEGVVEMKAGKMFLTIPVSGNSVRYEHREFNARLSLDEAFRGSNNRFSIICLDRVNPDELKHFLHNRSARKLNVDGIKAVKEAIAVAERDYAEEAPTRARMYKALENGGVVSGTDSLKLISDAVAIFRCANKGAKLTIVNDNLKKYNQLLDQMFMLSGAGGDPTDMVLAAEKKLGRHVVRVSLDAKGVTVAYSKALDSEMDNRLLPFAWMVKTRYKPSSKGVVAQKPTFVKLHHRPANETIKFEVGNIEEYVFPDNHPWNTPKAKAAQFEYPESTADVLGKLEHIRNNDEAFDETLRNFEWVRVDASVSYVENPVIVIPFATACIRDDEVGCVGLRLGAENALIYLSNGDPVRLRKASRAYTSLYENSAKAYDRFERVKKLDGGKSLLELASVKFCTTKESINPKRLWSADNGFYNFDEVRGACYSVQAILDKKTRSYITMDGVGDNVDEFFGITKPEKFAPCVLREISAFSKDWSGIVLYELTDELDGAIARHEASAMKVFDTMEDAYKYMSEKCVMTSSDGDAFVESFYGEVADYPKEWETRGKKVHKAITAWQR